MKQYVCRKARPIGRVGAHESGPAILGVVIGRGRDEAQPRSRGDFGLRLIGATVILQTGTGSPLSGMLRVEQTKSEHPSLRDVVSIQDAESLKNASSM
jgi:hypothetical protein